MTKYICICFEYSVSYCTQTFRSGIVLTADTVHVSS